MCCTVLTQVVLAQLSPGALLDFVITGLTGALQLACRMRRGACACMRSVHMLHCVAAYAAYRRYVCAVIGWVSLWEPTTVILYSWCARRLIFHNTVQWCFAPQLVMSMTCARFGAQPVTCC